MSKLQEGDRVVVYGQSDQGLIPRPRREGDRGTVFAFHNDGFIYITFDDQPGPYKFHPKQCRKLKKKERRRVYLPENQLAILGGNTQDGAYLRVYRAKSDELVEFVEVKKNK